MTKEQVLQGKAELLKDWGILLTLSPFELMVLIGIFGLLVFEYYNILKLKKHDTEREYYNKRNKSFKIRLMIFGGGAVVIYTVLSVMNMGLREIDNYKNHYKYEQWEKEYMKPYIYEQEVKEVKITDIKYEKGYFYIKLDGYEEELIVHETNITKVEGAQVPKVMKVIVLEETFEYNYKEGQVIPVEEIKLGNEYIKEISKG